MHKANKGIIAATLVVALGIPTTAVAQELIVRENGSNSVEVSYADLNLANAQGQRAMEQRVRTAAKRVCGYNTHRLSMQEANDLRTCVDTAIDEAMTVLASNSTDRMVVAVRTDVGNSRR
ncbi:UrcA family protein [Aurantiacibacter hainanensis]|uniref:UrcA family protein n=1 Tax=Aurantiacibacter hainanensis TaxID=3076114 RepID=UPI0030C71F38